VSDTYLSFHDRQGSSHAAFGEWIAHACEQWFGQLLIGHSQQATEEIPAQRILARSSRPSLLGSRSSDAALVCQPEVHFF